MSVQSYGKAIPRAPKSNLQKTRYATTALKGQEKSSQLSSQTTSHLICNSVFFTLSIVYILIQLPRFGSWIFFRLQVKRGLASDLV
jgi:hypothetical protein